MGKRIINLFPKVTYNRLEFFRFNEMSLSDTFIMEMDSDYAVASSTNIIWLSKPSWKWLIHELLHIIGWRLKLPFSWHIILHKILS